MKDTLKKLLEICEKQGEKVVRDAMDEAYCDGAQAEDVVYSALDILENK